MIPGSRGGPARPLRAAVAVTLAVAAAAVVCLPSASAAATTPGTVRAAAPAPAAKGAAAASAASSWARAWSWRPGSAGLPEGCAPYTTRKSAGPHWAPSLVTVADGTLQLATASASGRSRATGSGVGCTGRAQRYGRVEVRARMPRGVGLVGRIALWPSAESRGSDWSGLTVTSGDTSPAYATNGCGDRAYGAAIPSRLTGAFHTYVLTWSPDGFSVAVDGRELYRDEESFHGPRWLGISLAATGAAPARSRLLVERVTVFRWTGPVPAAEPATREPSASAPDTDDFAGIGEGGAARAAAGGLTTVVGSAAGGSTTPGEVPAAGSTADGPAPAQVQASQVATAGRRSALVAVLEDTRLGTPWLVGGGCVAVGVLVGVLRAALVSRRRPPVPR